MTHYTVAIIIPPSDMGSARAFVDRQMAPYNEELSVPPYVCYTLETAEKDIDEAINRLRLIIERREPLYDLDKCQEQLDSLLATTPTQEYDERRLRFNRFDSFGRPVSTANPDGKWDWYVIGGRWDGWINDRETNAESVDDNSASIADAIARDKITHAIITPDGAWHERGQMGWFGMLLTENADWDEQARAIIRPFADHHVVLVDAHV